MKKIGLALVIVLPLAVGSVFALRRLNMAKQERVYVVGVPAYWQTLIPPLQHSLVGFGVMINQFEPLIRRGRKGVLEPLAASSWDFSEDRKHLRFKIDTSRQFSDGSKLFAKDFKKSWEDGLRMQPRASNSSLADALSNLKGFSKLNEKGSIDGLRVVGADVLELEFEKPVRSALDHLSGVRYSVYKTSGSITLGTGPYVITEKDRILELVPNKFYSGEKPGLKNVRIIVAAANTAFEKLKTGEIDAQLFAENAKLPGCDEGGGGQVQCAFGQEGTHLIVALNGLPGAFFSKPANRSAFQALVLQRFKGEKATWPIQTNGFLRDPQSFLKFQAGRLSDEEAAVVINEGERHIPEFIKATNKHPLRLSQKWDWLVEYLTERGVHLEKNIRATITEEERLNIYHKTFDVDVMPMTASVYDGDPDCLYHLLGRSGAIFSPMIERSGVTKMLEGGRRLLDQSKLHLYYRDVSKTILQEVPYIHLGYYYRGVAYNSTRVHVNESFGNRNNQSLTVFSPN